MMVANYLISHIPAKNMPSNLRILTALSFAQEDSLLENPKTHVRDFSAVTKIYGISIMLLPRLWAVV